MRGAFARFGGAILFAVALLAAPAGAQVPPASLPPQGAEAFSAAQLDQLLAPIALYPDPLLGQILIAATYPLEVVQADRWLQDPENASLRGDALLRALESQPWDASVKSLVAFPQILSMMDYNLEWTEQLGDAFLGQQAQVMDRVQDLRRRAQAAGTLNSTPQQMVTNDGQAIEIVPPDDQNVYVPVYNPNIMYGAWPYPDELPYYFDYPGYGFGSLMGFAIVAPLWGWDRWDWHHHGLDIGTPRARPFTHGPALRPGAWQHDPAHRGGVPYRNDSTRARFAGRSGPPPEAGFRGYAPSGGATAAPAFPVSPPGAAGAERSFHGPAIRPGAARTETPRAEAPRAAVPRAAAPSPPAFESFGRGVDASRQEQRGASSRAAPSFGGGRREHR
jgi:hypothetical protein